MPQPSEGESRDHFISRCIPIVIQDGTAENPEQAVAICNSIWERGEKMTANEELLRAVRSRKEKKTEFGYGIMTADRHVKNVLDTVGLPLCYRYLSDRRSQTSFDDVMRKAASTLVYSNPDMEVESKEISRSDGIELPKNTLIAFRHVLSSNRKDRDGDVMHPDGMIVDPRMLLLWQHVHTAPIGKLICLEDQNPKKLVVISAIVDMNELCHDSAVMVDNEMARFSHGFRAIEFTKIKAGENGEQAEGFDITKSEVMEESLVSVPANVDAGVEDVMLSLVEGGKLTSPIMKQIGQSIREKQPASIPVNLDLKVTVNGQEVKNVSEDGEGKNRKEFGSSKKEFGSSKKENGVAQNKAGGTEGKKDYYYEGLNQSYEWIGVQLQAKIGPYLAVYGVGGDWIYLLATYADHAIFRCDKQGIDHYYKVGWVLDGRSEVAGCSRRG